MKHCSILLLVIIALLSTSCRKDCVCKYYKRDKLYDIKVWDDKHLTEEDCESMNDSYSLELPLEDYGIDLGAMDFRVECSQD